MSDNLQPPFGAANNESANTGAPQRYQHFSPSAQPRSPWRSQPPVSHLSSALTPDFSPSAEVSETTLEAMGAGGGSIPPQIPTVLSSAAEPVPPKRPKHHGGKRVPSRTPRQSGPGWGALVGAMVVTALASSAVTIGVITAETGGGNTQASTSTSQAGQTPVVSSHTGGQGPDWQAVAAAVRPATVTISVEGGNSAGTGSGVIYDGQGHIITNHHVVSNVLDGGKIAVSLSDGRIYDAEVVGTDATTDLAVIRLLNPPDNLVSARLTSSDDLQVGQPVMAIGSPLGLSDTVTTGVISALDRPVVVQGEPTTGGDSEEDSETFPFGPWLQQEQQQQTQAEPVITNAIQVDASINPGNSGGPLFDENGAVIGINSSIASMSTSASTAGSIGLGFAIPSDLVSNVVDQIITTGVVQHALLGVQIASATAEIDGAARIGAGIAEVTPGGAAETAGLKVGDVIVGFNGQPVVSGSSLTGFVRRHKAGDTVTLQVVRDGKESDIEVVLQTK